MRAPFQSRFAARLRAEAAARATGENGDPAAALARIETLSQLARTIWFSLLAYLAFVTLTLFSVRDVDFFSLERAIALPLVNISIPTESFFLAAPVLGAALHIYLHLYLLKLWDTVATLPATVDSHPVGERMFPWMIGDWALRRRPDRDAATAPRPMAWLADWTTFLLVWAAAPLTLFGFWWRSMPAHEEWLTLVIAVPLAFSVYASRKSLRRAHRRLRAPGAPHRPATQRQRWAQRTGFMLLTVALGAVSWLRTEGGLDAYLDDGPTLAEIETVLGFEVLAPIDLAGADLARQPPDWLSRETARRAFRVAWCRDHDLPPLACEAPQRDDYETEAAFDAARLGNVRARLQWCAADGRGLSYMAECNAVLDALDRRFEAEWAERRAGYLATLTSPDLSGRDLRRANAAGAFLVGLDLSEARLEGINLSEARLEGADLGSAGLERANLSEAQLDGANLFRAVLQEANLRLSALNVANLREARLQGADLSRASLVGATLIEARLEGANLIGAQMKGAHLTGAALVGARLVEAQLEGANLVGAQLEGAHLFGARLEGANLLGAQLNGANLIRAWLKRATFFGTVLEGANLSDAQLEGADLTGAQAPSVNWAGATLGTSPIHAADFTGGQNLTQRQLDEGPVIGDAETILPRDAETGTQLTVWSCWERPPSALDTILERAASSTGDIEALRAQLLCADTKPRVRTGTPAPE